MRRPSICLMLAVCIMLGARPMSARDLLKSFEVENTVYQLCAGAESNMNSRNYGPAVDALNRAAAYDPTSYSGTVHTDLLRCYRALKQYDRAIAEGKKVLSLDPNRTSILYDMAMVYYDMDRFDQTQTYLNRYMAVETDPGARAQAQRFLKETAAYGFLQQGRKALDKDKYAEAIKWLNKAASFDPSPYSAPIHANLLHAYQENRQFEKAIAEGKTALALAPNDANVLYKLALASANISKFDDAIMWMQRYVAAEPDATRRSQAQDFIKQFADDKAQYEDPANKKPDYYDSMRPVRNRYRWAKDRFPLKVAITSGAGVYGYRSTFPNLVKRAFDIWCEASGKKLDYKIVSNPAEADIKIVWQKEALEIDLDHSNVRPDGLTTYGDIRDGYFSKALVQVRTVNPFRPNEVVTDGEVQHIVTHEIGHALGLQHSPLVTDVMYFRSAEQQDGPPTTRDRKTMARIYADYPEIAFVPKTPAQAPPVVFAPPPAFIPPTPPDMGKVVPPMFIPPPLPDPADKLVPPMFTPPPISDGATKSTPPNTAPPMFTPPPVSAPPKPKAQPKKPDTTVPFFTPPPL